MSASQTEQLVDDLRTLAEDAGHVFNDGDSKTHDTTGDLRQRIAETLRSAEKTLEMLNQKASDGIESTENMIKTQPYKTMGIGIAVGLVLGLLFKRK